MKSVHKILITGGSGFIGTNLIELLKSRNVEILNLDISSPLSAGQNQYWKKLDFLNKDLLEKEFEKFQPDSVVDLAARTDVDQDTTVESDYYMNINGVSNIIEVLQSSQSVKRVIFTSTQYVKRPGELPFSDEDYDPHTVYGESKVKMERLIRSSKIPCAWTIIRPTNVWGPWHFRYRSQFFKVLKLGLYFHPGNADCVKSYAFVGNVVEQILGILEEKPLSVNSETLYVGDAPLPLIDWVNAFSVSLTGKRARVTPRRLIYGLSKLGDWISILTRKPFLITTSRYNSMVESYLTPMDKTFAVLGPPRYTLSEGVELTTAWLEAYEKEAL